jgi:NTP pyrophosphatase (non-canonical NTP hydrolase)
MTPEQYQKQSAVYNKSKSNAHLIAGLASECGEVCKLFQKMAYKGEKISLEQLSEELGDVIWYVTQLATKYHLDMDDILCHNLYKLDIRNEGGNNV